MVALPSCLTTNIGDHGFMLGISSNQGVIMKEQNKHIK